MYIRDEIQIFIKLMINSKKWKFETKVPSEQDLATNFFCSRLTVRKAYHKLIKEGYLYSVQGLGYFVSKEIKENSGGTEVAKTTIEFGHKKQALPSEEVDWFKQLNLPDTPTNLNFQKYTKKYYENAKKVEKGNFYEAIEAFVNPDLMKKVSSELMSESVSFAYWEAGIVISHRKRIIVTRKLEASEQRKFNTKTNELFSIVYGALFDENGTLIEYSKKYIRHDKVKIFCEQELA